MRRIWKEAEVDVSCTQRSMTGLKKNIVESDGVSSGSPNMKKTVRGKVGLAEAKVIIG